VHVAHAGGWLSHDRSIAKWRFGRNMIRLLPERINTTSSIRPGYLFRDGYRSAPPIA
jgi:hypothetical protein